MKTTFKDIFMELEDDMVSLPETTIYENTGITSDTIKSNAFSQLGLHKKKKSFSKTFKLTVIAATLGAALIAGTTAFAQGQFPFLFKDYVSGEDSTPVFAGENQQFTSDKVNVQLMGLTGDNTQLYSVVQITLKDHANFVEDYENTYIQPYDEEFKDGGIPAMDEIITDKEPAPQRIVSEYEFENNQVIKGKINIPGNKNGCHLTLQNHGLYFYHIDEIIYHFSGNESNTECQQIEQDIKNKYSPTLTKNQFIKYDIDQKTFCIVTKTKMDIPYTISFDANYETAYKDFDIANHDTLINIGGKNGFTLDIQSIHAESSGITITGHYQSSLKSAVKMNSLAQKQKLTVTMNDGTIIEPYYEGFSFDNDEKANIWEGSMEIHYAFMEEDSTGTLITMLIDTTKIQSVTFHDMTFR